MRRPPTIDPANPASLAVWLTEARVVVESLHAVMVDATARKSLRRHSRHYLKEQARKHFHRLGSLITALDPAPPPAADGAPSGQTPAEPTVLAS